MSAARDTIFALSTAAGRGAIAVVRLSGAGARRALEAHLAGPLPPPRRFSRRRILTAGGELLDRGVVVWLPAEQGGSYTGEDMAELQVHGGPAVVRRLLASLGQLAGLRPAEPGEFTRRAFQAGRLDLLEAEAVADLVAAETERQREQALAGGTGALSARLERWQQALIAISAQVEAAIDFAEEELPEDLLERSLREIAALREDIAAAVEEVRLGERLREGFEIALVGAPNAGKSSLLNALARREAAIVHETAGTTRDAIEVRMDLAGFPVTLVDTAGLRSDARDPVEQEGVRRAAVRGRGADLVLALFDSQMLPFLDQATLDLVDARTLPLLSKADLARPDRLEVGGRPGLAISSRSGEGLETLQRVLAERIEALCEGRAGSALFARERHRAALAGCAAALGRAAVAGEAALVAEDLRAARDALGRLAGRVDVEDLLDHIFREFCIGK